MRKNAIEHGYGNGPITTMIYRDWRSLYTDIQAIYLYPVEAKLTIKELEKEKSPKEEIE